MGGEVIPFWYWLILGVGFLALEVFAPGAVLMWFGFGAILTGLIYWLVQDMPLAGQILIFTIASAASIFGWRLFRKKMPEPESPDPELNNRLQAFVGQEYVLSSAIENGSGRMRLGDGTWTIRGPDLPAGSKIRIVSVDGTRFQVEPVL